MLHNLTRHVMIASQVLVLLQHREHPGESENHLQHRQHQQVSELAYERPHARGQVHLKV